MQLRNSYVGIHLKEIIKNPGSSIDLIMEDGDIIRIPKQQQIVRVNGRFYKEAGPPKKGKFVGVFYSI